MNIESIEFNQFLAGLGLVQGFIGLGGSKLFSFVKEQEIKKLVDENLERIYEMLSSKLSEMLHIVRFREEQEIRGETGKYPDLAYDFITSSLLKGSNVQKILKKRRVHSRLRKILFYSSIFSIITIVGAFIKEITIYAIIFSLTIIVCQIVTVSVMFEIKESLEKLRWQ